MKDFDAALGKTVESQRESLGMTQTDVARKMRADGHLWHQQTLVRVEAGQRPVRASELVSLASALGLSVPDLIEHGDTPLVREWPRHSRISPDAREVRDYLGHVWTQVSLGRWESDAKTFIVPFWFLAEHYGPLREVAS